MSISQPKISVIIPTYNRAGYLIDTLDSLVKNEISPSDFEVIVVNNNSDDNTKQLVTKFIHSHKRYRILQVVEKNQGASFARNRGIEESAADILLFVDDDETAGQNFIGNWLRFFEKFPNAVGGGGSIEVKFEYTKPAWISHFLMPLLGEHQISNSIKKYSRSKFPFAGNMAWRKEIFVKFGKLKTNLGRKADGLLAGEEKEFYKRIRTHTDQIYHVPAAKAYHRVDKDRLSKEFIRRQALGLGQSMKLQLEKASFLKKTMSWTSEIGKFLISVPLALGYLFIFQPAKAKMLFKFRKWIWEGYFSVI